MKQLYAIVTNECNLSCPHCDIRLGYDNYHEEKFLKELNKFEGEIILFGGEPLLYKERLMNILSLNKINSISTNLINIDDEFIDYFKKIRISTSWNLSRFTDVQYQLWLNNLKRLEENNISCQVLITLTQDLINMNIQEFIGMIKNWDKKYIAIHSILFEQLIDDKKTKEFYTQVDEWLCKIHSLWLTNNIQIENKIIQNLSHWQYDCTKIYTLHPNGKITRGCPHDNNIQIVNECLVCQIADRCRPCRLQQHCTYPKKLEHLVKQKEKKYQED